MNKSANYRHELKYPISYGDYLALRQRLRPVMQADRYAGGDGCYRIHSIYFDNLYDKALREKISGVPRREKFRIRYYNSDLSFIHLEKKVKHNSLCLKSGTVLTEPECRRLLAGDLNWMPEHPAALVRELYDKMQCQLLRPRVLVSYLREPYVYPIGNVRVTFDSQVCTSLYQQHYLEPARVDISAMDSPAQMLMEVKYDAFLPELIAQLLQTAGVRQEAYSKYGASRRFG